MRFCKECGTPYTKALGVCPKCNAKAVQEEAGKTRTLTEEEAKVERKRSWIGITIGVPGLIGFIYVMYYIMKILSTP